MKLEGRVTLDTEGVGRLLKSEEMRQMLSGRAARSLAAASGAGLDVEMELGESKTRARARVVGNGVEGKDDESKLLMRSLDAAGGA